uniref:Uncharacterized protein n=1 Tax=Arundo donax TaxID=35708 RepID=A0A0A9DH07_ARUDO
MAAQEQREPFILPASHRYFRSAGGLAAPTCSLWITGHRRVTRKACPCSPSGLQEIKDYTRPLDPEDISSGSYHWHRTLDLGCPLKWIHSSWC